MLCYFVIPMNGESPQVARNFRKYCLRSCGDPRPRDNIPLKSFYNLR